MFARSKYARCKYIDDEAGVYDEDDDGVHDDEIPYDVDNVVGYDDDDDENEDVPVIASKTVRSKNGLVKLSVTKMKTKCKNCDDSIRKIVMRPTGSSVAIIHSTKPPPPPKTTTKEKPPAESEKDSLPLEPHAKSRKSNDTDVENNDDDNEDDENGNEDNNKVGVKTTGLDDKDGNDNNDMDDNNDNDDGLQGIVIIYKDHTAKKKSKKKGVFKKIEKVHADEYITVCTLCDIVKGFTKKSLAFDPTVFPKIVWANHDFPKRVDTLWDNAPGNFRLISAWKKMRDHHFEKHIDVITKEDDLPPLYRTGMTEFRNKKRESRKEVEKERKKRKPRFL